MISQGRPRKIHESKMGPESDGVAEDQATSCLAGDVDGFQSHSSPVIGRWF